jgi:toxin ParE1/3/4
MRFTFRPAAADDLEQIRGYIANDNPDAAKRVADTLLSAIQGLTQAPSRGRPGRWPNTRELVVPPYIIPYRVRDQTVEILRIFHSAREWPERGAA